MLSRGTSNASTRLRRAKSTSSARNQSPSKQEPIDPEVARQHALAAANHAFEQAAGRRVNKHGNENGLQGKQSMDAQREALLSRRESVHFTRASQIARTQPLKPHERSNIPWSKTKGADDAHLITTSQQLRPEVTIEKAESNSTVSGLLEQYLTPVDDIASAPSSYRKLKKAKSMYTPREHPPVIYNSGIVKNARHLTTGKKVGEDQPRPALRAPKSLSFLRRGSGRQPNPIHQNQSQDVAIQMARDRYLDQLEKQRLKERPPPLFTPLARRQQKGLRKTVRTSSHTSYGSAISSASAKIQSPKEREKGFGDRARGLSASLKSKIKRVFLRSSEINDKVPAQQVDASRSHYGTNLITSGVDEQYREIPAPDEETLSRVQSRAPSLRLVPSNPQMRSRAGSMSSVHSADSTMNSRSRVTSWTNSTAANTLATRQVVDKRLSIIQELGGPHIPSSSSKRYHQDGEVHSNFRAPMYSTSDTGYHSSPVDSRRVYSALMKRLDRDSPRARQDEADFVQGSDYGGTNFAVPSTNGRPGSIASYRTTTTIRQVHDEMNEGGENAREVGMSKSSGSNDIAYSATDGGLPLKDITTAAHQQSRKMGSRDRSQASNFYSLPYNSVHRAEYPGKDLGLTPQQAADFNEKKRFNNRQALRQTRSAFFPHSPSPEISSQRLAGNLSPVNQNEPRGITIAKRGRLSRFTEVDIPVRQPSAAGSVSVYSRTTGGTTPMPAQSTVSLAKSDNSELGTAVIMTSNTSKYGITPAQARAPRKSSVKLSHDWGAWMSSKIADLEEESRGDDSYRREGSGHHHREHAQIDNDDTTVTQGRTDVLRQPPDATQGDVLTRAHLKHKISSQMFPLINIGPPHDYSAAEQRPSLSARSSSTNTVPRRSPAVADKENILVPGSAYPRLNTVRSIQSQSSLRHKSHPQEQGGAMYSSSRRIKLGPSNQRQLSENTLNQRNSLNNLGDRYERPTSRINTQLTSDDIVYEMSQDAYAEENYNTDLAGPANAASMGTQRMVDLFLSSRRGKMTRVSEDSGTVAFL
ncbi:MAG: hypothetical protein M1835_008220 [Candelina submexicana]|nr:MAG: hypothetical protein M1835_008220 [Candelina submexicana]